MYQIPVSLIYKTRWNIDLESKDKLFLLLVAMHYNKILDDVKFTGKMKLLREGTLNRRINTYHCNINDKWYNDENMVDVLEDVWNGSKQAKMDIPLKQFLIYINKWINKPQNYCVNYCYTQFIKPVVERYAPKAYGWGNDTVYDRYGDFLKEYGFRIEIVRFDDFDRYVTGYCCEDCDGPYEQYRESQFNYYYAKNNLIEIKKEIFGVLDTFRTKDYLRNPDRVILT